MGSVVGKKELVQKVMAKTGLTKKDVEKVYNTLIETIISELKDGRKVYIAGLGTFKPVEKPATEKRNPQTGGIINIPPRTILKFRPSSSIKILKVNG